jgi:hypothetical protein
MNQSKSIIHRESKNEKTLLGPFQQILEICVSQAEDLPRLTEELSLLLLSSTFIVCPGDCPLDYRTI